jgi:hypothetical protein
VNLESNPGLPSRAIVAAVAVLAFLTILFSVISHYAREPAPAAPEAAVAP